MSKSFYLTIASFIVVVVTAINYSIANGDDNGSRTHGGGYIGGYSSGFSGGHK